MRSSIQILLVALACVIPLAHAQNIQIEKIDLKVSGLTILAEVRIPKSDGKPGMVIVLPSAGGIDGTGAQYIHALNARGIATAEMNLLMQEDWLKNVAMSKIAARYAVNQLGVDPRRIGIMGFSHGAMVSLIAVSESWMARLAPQIPIRFKAHAALYPVCAVVRDTHEAPSMNWKSMRPSEGGEASPYKGMFDRMTGGKVLLLAAQQEDYEDAPVECQKLTTILNTSSPGSTEFTLYPDATHGWDVPVSRSYNHSSISRKNGNIRHFRDPATYEKSLTAVTDFFARELAQ